MSFTEPAAPIAPDYQANLSSVVRKYMAPSDPTFAAELSRATPSARRALQTVDAERMERGGKALSQPTSAVALRAASTGESVVGEPDTGFWGDVSRNATEFVGGLPRLPLALANEVMDLPSTPTKITEGIDRASNPIEAIGNVAQAPGVRLIPGAFVASQFGTDMPGVQGLIDNPVWTALDLAPYAGKIAGSTKAVRAAESLASAGERVPKYGTNLRYGQLRGGPKLTPTGDLAPNAIGRAMDAGRTRVGRTRGGVILDSAFGKQSGDLMELVNRTDVSLADPKYAERNAPWAKPLIEARQKIAETRTRHNITPERDAEIHQIITRGDQASLARLTPDELAYVTDLDGIQASIRADLLATGKVAEVTFTTPNGQTVTELLPAQRANRILKSRAELARREILVTQAERARSGTASLDESRTRMGEIQSSTLPTQMRKRAYRGELAAMERSGYLTDTARLELNKVGSKVDMAAWEAKWSPLDPQQFRGTIPTLDVNALRTTLAPFARTDPTVSRLNAYLKAGDWAQANREVRALQRRTKFKLANVDLDDVAAQLSRLHTIDRAAQNLEIMPAVKGIDKARKSVANLERRAMPARMSEVVNDQITARLGTEVADLQRKGLLSTEQAAAAAEALTLRSMEVFKTIDPALEPLARKIASEVRQTWMELVDQGYEPRFVHRAGPGKMLRDNPRVSGRVPEIGSVQARTLDFGASATSPALALDRQIVELLANRGTEQFLSTMESTFGRPRAEVVQSYVDFARDAFNKNPNKNFQAHLDDLIARDYSPSTLNPDILIPRSLAYTLERIVPKDFGVIARNMDRAMGVFRTALLPLSPRWYIYNATGNAIMVGARQGLSPFRFRNLVDGYRTARTGILPDGRSIADLNLPAMSSSEAARIIRENAQWSRDLDLSSKTGRAAGIWNYSAGKFLRRILDSELTARAQTTGSKVVSGGYFMNELVDDWARAATFIDAEKSALRKGMSAADAQAVAESAVRKVAVNWDRMTPIERSTVRFIFPFYSFAKKILEYAYTYPADHPFRTAITASFVRAELEDFGTGLPQRYFSLIDIGGVMPEGVKDFMGMKPDDSFYLSLDGMNPFRDVASYASLLGFLSNPMDPSSAIENADIGVLTSQMNPMAQLFLRAVGVDPATGLSDPYQQVQYDPSTGGLRIVNEFNPVTGIPQAFVPQTKLFFDLAGVNRDFQRLVKSNPDAASRRLLSSAGFPVLGRSMNRDEEIIKTEVRRYEDLSRTKSRALRTGDLDLLNRYESLRPYADRLRELDASGGLDKYRPSREEIDRAIEQGNRRSPLAS